jgi:hypothetical protein
MPDDLISLKDIQRRLKGMSLYQLHKKTGLCRRTLYNIMNNSCDKTSHQFRVLLKVNKCLKEMSNDIIENETTTEISKELKATHTVESQNTKCR